MTDTLAVLHIADLFRDPKMRLPSLRDWQKVRRYLDGTWPKPIPPRYVWDGNLSRLGEWMQHALTQASFVAIDTEYIPVTQFLTHIGIGYPEMTETLLIEWRELPWQLRQGVKGWVSLLTESKPTVFQNAMADIPVLEKALGIPYEHYQRVDDLMLLHAACWSEWPHTLEFIASMYSSYPKMKHLAGEDMLTYLHGDVLTTIEGWLGLMAEVQ